jgi:hypothetical protein
MKQSLQLYYKQAQHFINGNEQAFARLQRRIERKITRKQNQRIRLLKKKEEVK